MARYLLKTQPLTKLYESSFKLKIRIALLFYFLNQLCFIEKVKAYAKEQKTKVTDLLELGKYTCMNVTMLNVMAIKYLKKKGD